MDPRCRARLGGSVGLGDAGSWAGGTVLPVQVHPAAGGFNSPPSPRSQTGVGLPGLGASTARDQECWGGLSQGLGHGAGAEQGAGELLGA